LEHAHDDAVYFMYLLGAYRELVHSPRVGFDLIAPEFAPESGAYGGTRFVAKAAPTSLSLCRAAVVNFTAPAASLAAARFDVFLEVLHRAFDALTENS
jgi:hypothetical protein